MKKFAALLFLCFLIIFIISNQSKKVVPAFKEQLTQDTGKMRTYQFHLEELNVTTRNYQKYLAGTESTLVGAVALINPICEKTLGGIYYQFYRENIDLNMQSYEEDFTQMLNDSVCQNDFIKVSASGIRMKIIDIHTTEKVAKAIQKKFPKITYLIL